MSKLSSKKLKLFTVFLSIFLLLVILLLVLKSEQSVCKGGLVPNKYTIGLQSGSDVENVIDELDNEYDFKVESTFAEYNPPFIFVTMSSETAEKVEKNSNVEYVYQDQYFCVDDVAFSNGNLIVKIEEWWNSL